MDRNCIVITCSNAQGSGAKGIRLLIHKIYFKESILDNLYVLYFAFPPFTKWWKTPTTNQENYSKDTGSNTVSFQKWLLTETAIKTKFTIMHFWKHLEYPKTPDLCTCTNYIVKQIKPGSATKEATGQIQNFTELARQICYQIVHMLFPIPSLDTKPLIWSILPHLRNHTRLVLPNWVIFTTDTWKHLLILPESQLWT